MAAIMMYGPGRCQSVRPVDREKSVKASLTVICASMTRRRAKTAQTTAIRSQKAAGPLERALDAMNAMIAQSA
jgi:hypothetical protein